MKRLLLHIFFLPLLLVAQDAAVQIPEVQLEECRLDLHQVGGQQWLLDSALSKYTHSLSNYLRQHGPIFVKEYGALSSAFYRGTSAAHTQLLWNGVPLNSLSTGQIDLALFPVNLFSEVKLNSGGHSVLSGSGAIGGSIQLNNQLHFNPENTWQLDWTKGYFGLENQSASYQFGNGKSAMHLQYLSSENQNNFEYINTGVYNTPVDKQEHAYKASKQYLLNYAYRANKSHFAFHLWSSDNFREVPVGMLSSNPNALQWDDALRTKVFWKRLGNNYQLELFHAYLEEYFRYTSNFVDSRIEAKNHLSSLEYQHHYQSISAFVGVNMQNRSVVSNYYGEQTDEQLLAGSFSLKQSGSQYTSVASVRGESHPLYNVPTLYSLSANYKFSDDLLWKMKFAKNFKAPTFNDLYWIGDDAIGNRQLSPELAYSSEITLEYSKIALTCYSNWMQQMIQWQPNTNGVWTPQNLERVWSRGLEVKRAVSEDLGIFKVSFLGSYAFTLSTLEESNVSDDRGLGQQLAYVPIHKISSVTHFDIEAWRMTISSAFNDEVSTTSDASETLPSYLLTDLILQYQSKHAPIILSVKINNITNKSYQVYEWFPMPGRHLIFNINLKF